MIIKPLTLDKDSEFLLKIDPIFVETIFNAYKLFNTIALKENP